MHALDQELQEAVEAAALRAAHRSVVHVECAGAAVDALDGMDGIGNLDIRFLQGSDEGGLLEQQETTAADMRDRDGLRQHLSQDRTDLLQEMRAEFLAVRQADGIEFRHIDERRRVIVAVEAEVIGIAKPYHDHAAVVEKARRLVGDGGAHIAHLFVLFRVDIVQDGDEPRNPVVPVERELLGVRQVRHLADDEVEIGVPERRSRAHDALVHRVQFLAVHAVAELPRRLADEHIFRDAEPVDNGLAHAENAVRAVLPDDFLMAVFQESLPEGVRDVLLYRSKRR